MDLAAVCQRLADRWDAPVRVNQVYVAHQERTVFETVTPSGARVVVKAFADHSRAAAEAVAIRAAASSRVPVPDVVDRLPGVLVMSWLDGQPLLSTSPDTHWAAVGAALRRLHDHAAPEGVPGFAGSGNWWQGFRAWLPGACAQVGELLPPTVAGRLRRLLATGIPTDDVPANRLLHGDSATIHWRIRPGGDAAALDFGDACVGDPVWDLVVLTHWDEGRLPTVLDGYRADPALRSRVTRLFEPYRVSRHLLAVEWLRGHDYDPTPTLRELTRVVAGCPELSPRSLPG